MKCVVPGACILMTAAAVADAPLMPPSRLERWSANRQYVAVADPKRDAVSVYRMEKGVRTELWSIAGWQRSFEPADDGQHMVVCYSGLNLLPLSTRLYKYVYVSSLDFEPTKR